MLCCLGDVIEDVVVWLTADIATGTDTPVTIHRRRGGSAANVAVAAANTGTRVRFIGRVGSDAIGRSLIGELAIAGVDARVQQEGRTGTIVVLVDDAGERSMLPDRAAAVELDTIDDADLVGVTWLHVPAYSLVIEPLGEASREAIRKVQRTGGVVSIDASSVAIIENFGVDRFSAMIDDLRPDVLFCNADEGHVLGMEDSRGAGAVDLTIVKDGGDPAVAYSGGRVVATVPAFTVNEVRDTTGAGDAFAAGFIVARMAGVDIEGAITAGHRRAAEVLTRYSP